MVSGGDVIFSTNGPFSGGVTHTPGTPSITVANGGDYQISYEVNILVFGGETALAYAIVMNGTVQNSTRYGQIGGQNNTTRLAIGPSILTIPNGSTITLRNIGATTHTLVTATDGVTIVNAALRLIRIS
ncbi:hypothetical protein Q5W86_14220 [Shouchella clausii]|nr:hypothetical protein [Shouchella clausii]MDO7268953.1 hypothetical protein [Shouchella clausii]MDO7288832.1 hypothetical protein [Shouchella clausii]